MTYIFLGWLALLSHLATAQFQAGATNNSVQYTDSTATVEIESIYKMLVNGYDFAGLAGRYSQDSGSYKVGGELGWSTMKDCAPEYRSVVLTLAEDGLSRPFRTDFGYHIVQLIGQKDSLYSTRHILMRVD